jgi:hypothetical protein
MRYVLSRLIVDGIVPHLVESLDGFHAGIGLEVGDLISWLADLGDAEGACTSEHNDVEKRVGTCGMLRQIRAKSQVFLSGVKFTGVLSVSNAVYCFC